MRNHLTIFLIVVLYFLKPAAGSIVSGNSVGKLFGHGTIENNKPVVTMVTEGEFATDSQTLNTLYSSDNRTYRFLDGLVGAGDQQTYSQWSGGKYVSVIFDLNELYPVYKIQLWTLSDHQRYTDGFEVLLSTDGKEYISRGYFKNEFPRDSNCFTRQDAVLDTVAKVRYVRLNIRRSSNSYQQQIGEIAIVSCDSGDCSSNIVDRLAFDTVSLDVESVSSGAVLLDWSGFAAVDRKVVCWKIYKSLSKFNDSGDKNAELVETIAPDIYSTVVSGLKPSTDYYFGITVVYDGSGEFTELDTYHVTTPAPLECKTFGDMLAVNHFPKGGGAHQSRPNEEHWRMVALDMLARTPFKETRWWEHSPKWVKEFQKRGIGVLDWPRSDAAYIEEANALGIYAFSAGNEPDLSGKPLERYLEALKEKYKIVKGVDSRNIITAPTSGTDSHSLEWLDQFYAAGGKDYFDVLDIHTYCKVSGGHEVPDGIPSGAPEGLFAGMKKVRAIMAKYNDESKPVISTELGWTTTPYGNPAGEITKEMQAQYLTRAMVLSYVLGFKRVYWYSFFDEGDDIYNQEHNFGIVDYYMQAKPAYYALLTLGEKLGKGTLVGELEGVANPIYGYVFNVEGKYVTVVWNGNRDVVGEFSCESEKVMVTSLLGDEHNAHVADGKFLAKFGRSAIYITSERPIVLDKVDEVELKDEADGDKLVVNIPDKTFVVGSNKSGQLCVEVKNPLVESVSFEFSFTDKSGNIIADRKDKVTAGDKTIVKLPINAKSGQPSVEDYKLSILYNTSSNSYCFDETIWVRTLADIKVDEVKSFDVNIAGTDHKFVVIANSNLEVMVVPDLGGRIVEIIDRVTGTNQINIDYSVLDNLEGFSFKYCYWDAIRTSNGKRYFKNSPYDYKIEKGEELVKLTMSAENDILGVSKLITLYKDSSELNYDIGITNKTDGHISAKYYSHPEYMIGGSAEHNNDIFVLPAEQQVIEIPVWLGLGIRKHSKIDSGWCAIEDRDMNMAFVNYFDIDQIDDVRIWFDLNSYNAELDGKYLEYESGQSRVIKTKMEIKHNLDEDWYADLGLSNNK